MIGMALMAVLMCVNFTSCSEDDDPAEEKNENGIVTSGKKLVKMVCERVDEYYEQTTYEFTYDEEGQLATAKVGDRYDYDYFRFKWYGKNRVEIIVDYDEWDLYLKNGLVQFVDEDEFTYDESNRFINAKGDYDEEFKASWNGDKLMSVEFVDEYLYEFTYGKTCKNGYFPFFGDFIDFPYSILFIAHPEIVGMRSKQLPVSITTTDLWDKDTYTIDIQYVMKDGYISKIKTGDRHGEINITLTWE